MTSTWNLKITSDSQLDIMHMLQGKTLIFMPMPIYLQGLKLQRKYWHVHHLADVSPVLFVCDTNQTIQSKSHHYLY